MDAGVMVGAVLGGSGAVMMVLGVLPKGVFEGVVVVAVVGKFLST